MTMTAFSAERRHEAFWAKVRKTAGCWLWTGGDNGLGYGRFWDGSRTEYAHRFAWKEAYGSIPANLQVLHRCDTPPCVRPEHLFLGDQSANMYDMSRKGRHFVHAHPEQRVKGEQHGMHKLTEAQVLDIRRRPRRREFLQALAAEHGVSVGTLKAIRGRRAWRHL